MTTATHAAPATPAASPTVGPQGPRKPTRAPRTSSSNPRSNLRIRLARRAAAVVVFLLVWQGLTQFGVNLGIRFSSLPTVVEIVERFATQLTSPGYYLDIVQSLLRILTGFVLAAVAGVATGVALGRSRLAADTVGTVVEIIRPIPAIAMVPVAILMFPTDESGIVFITFLAAFFPVLVSTRHAVHALPTLWEDAVRTLGGSPREVLRFVVLPGILPGVFGGFSVGLGVAWICVVSAEMISGSLGIGYQTWQSYTIVDYPGTFVGMITIGILGSATSAGVEVLGRRATSWLPRGERQQ
ncbi:ABC transporter permease [Corynebacterium sp. AOP40-9SA-29]|uniref:ABC transporter permease n=1 Tax=Corynebacterium sp. AOP40-9SA-29 TaxID=3457677 RepID=UPI0040342280